MPMAPQKSQVGADTACISQRLPLSPRTLSCVRESARGAGAFEYVLYVHYCRNYNGAVSGGGGGGGGGGWGDLG